jgi:hypothetical protein
MKRDRTTMGVLGALLCVMLVSTGVHGQSQPGVAGVLRQLNASPTVQGTDGIKSYRLLFDAYLNMTEPPMPVGGSFNLKTIHPNMNRWDDVSGWAESNPDMAKAIIAARNRRIVGLPYGRDNVSSAYRSANLVADVAVDGSLRRNEFPYLDAAETIAAYATAEIYRRFEAGQTEQALELAVAHLAVARQFCDREFFVEKRHSILLLADALSNLREMFYTYRSQISADQYSNIAITEIPFLRPDRNALLMPEGDRIVSEALIRDVFDSRGQPDRSRFPSTFAAIQSEHEPLTRFGAARRWAMIAEVHGSLEASLERLTLVYDDWWRRWRIQEYDPILDIQTQFDRTNPVRYAAVIYSMQNIEELFDMRKQLIVAVNSTAVAAGLCAYQNTFGTIPTDHKRIYAQFMRKSSDIDPYDRNYDAFLYFVTNSRHAVDTPYGRVWIEPRQGILYSRGQNHSDDRAAEHTDDGLRGDIVVWPPLRVLAREQNLLN